MRDYLNDLIARSDQTSPKTNSAKSDKQKKKKVNSKSFLNGKRNNTVNNMSGDDKQDEMEFDFLDDSDSDMEGLLKKNNKS